MVAAPDGQKAILPSPAPADPVLEGHLDGDLHGHRAGISQKNLGQGRGRQLYQGPTKLDGGRVGQATEHDMGHAGELVGDGGVQNGMVVAMDGRPPRGHAVNELPAVREPKAHAARGDDLVHGQGVRRRGIGMPDVLAVKIKDVVGHGFAGEVLHCSEELRFAVAWASSTWTRGQT